MTSAELLGVLGSGETAGRAAGAVLVSVGPVVLFRVGVGWLLRALR